jgi:hypothetical protein
MVQGLARGPLKAEIRVRIPVSLPDFFVFLVSANRKSKPKAKADPSASHRDDNVAGVLCPVERFGYAIFGDAIFRDAILCAGV